MTRTLDASSYAALTGQDFSIFSVSYSGTSPAWQGYSNRTVVPANLLSALVGGKISVTYQTVAGTSAGTLELWIGQAAASGDAYDFDGNQVRLTFNGSNTRALSGAEIFTSDEVAFAFDASRPLVVSAFHGGTTVNIGGTPSPSGVGVSSAYTAGNNAGTTNITADATFSDPVGVVSINSVVEGHSLVARDFVWFTVRNRADNSPVNDAYWSGVGDITASVVDPETGGISSRSWFGAGGLIQIDDIPLLSTLTVQTVAVKLSQVSDRVNDLLRTYDCKQGQIQVYRGLYNPFTRQMVGPAFPRFVGYINEAPIKTPKENTQGDVTLTCTAHTQELTRTNTETRSDANQKLRSGTDNFLQDAAVVGAWQHFWGRASGTVGAPQDTSKQNK